MFSAMFPAFSVRSTHSIALKYGELATEINMYKLTTIFLALHGFSLQSRKVIWNYLELREGEPMSFRFGKKTRTLIKSPGVFIRSCGGPLVILTLMLSPLLAATLRASTLLDPQPENSSTPFGRSIAVVGDVLGDDVPDRQWGTS